MVVPRVAQELVDHLQRQLQNATTGTDAQMAREALCEFEFRHKAWIDDVRTTLQQPQPVGSAPATALDTQLELVADDAIEMQLLSSKLATRILDTAGQEFTNLRLRMLFAEGRTEFRSGDHLIPEALATALAKAWQGAGLSQDLWKLLGDQLHNRFAQHITQAYAEANRFLIANGVMREIDFAGAVRKAVSAKTQQQTSNTEDADSTHNAPTTFARTAHLNAPEAQTAQTPAAWWARARQQSQDVLGRIRDLFSEQVAPTTPPAGKAADTTRATPDSPSNGRGQAPAAAGLSPQLQALLDHAPTVRFNQFDATDTVRVDAGVSVSAADMDRYVQVVRQRSAELKQAASTPSEKATIEVVALMFQSILTEERLQPTLRVWFARLQIPVLRVALAEPEFFSTLQHPARRLIDRMGSCALGFDGNLSGDSASALETEIRRVVQVIEQYPETGRKVFQLAYDEFQQFLARHLQSRGQASKLVSVAQQVEQKETLAIQYTIEMRKQLDQMPVREGIRDFLFKVWAEVLAVATVKHDAKHPIMATLKQTASDLLWAASAKPSRTERSQVIAQLPKLLARLREGMTLLGLPSEQQEVHIKHISDVLADAFMSRTDSIAPEQLAAVTRNLSSLEDFLPQGDVSDLELDQDSIELITGIDASNITIITHGGQEPGEAVRAWAMELQIGAWFTLDHNNQVAQVQLAWRSDRGQLCLFATAQQKLFLMQLSRVASYLQTGLLVPAEAESLTVRATRAALEKLDANPERLLT